MNTYMITYYWQTGIPRITPPIVTYCPTEQYDPILAFE